MNVDSSPSNSSSSSSLPPTEKAPADSPRGYDRCRGDRHHFRDRHFHHHRGHGVVSGLVVIAWGGLLLLRELGAIDPTLRVWDFWPLLLVGLGLSASVRARSLGRRLFCLVFAIFGAGILAEKLGFSIGVAHFWPLVIVAAGLGIVWHALSHRHAHSVTNEKVSADELRRSVTMGGLELVVDSQQFKGGALSATMSGVEIDLRRAAMAGDEITLELSLLMSGLELCVPSNWQVVNDISPFMGNVEDRTEPSPDASGAQKKFLLRGAITMGAVTVKN